MIQVSEVFTSPPAEFKTDLQKQVYETLNRLGIEYKRVDNDPAVTMADCVEINKKLDCTVVKTLFLCNRQKTSFYLLMMPANKPFKTKDLSAQINSSRLSFADEADMLKYLDIRPGAVSVLGLMNDKDNAVKLLVDEDVLKNEYLGCHPCVSTTSLKIKTADVFGALLKAMHHEKTVISLPLYEIDT